MPTTSRGSLPARRRLALEHALDAFDGIDLAMIRRKSERMTDLFIALVDQELTDFGFDILSPREAARRGSQVSLAHPDGYAIMQALIARGVIGDFRAPDIMRFGFAPLYNRFEDSWRAAEVLANIIATREWDQPRFKERAKVT